MDIVDIIGKHQVSDAYSRMEREANKIGLGVNEDKTKFLMVAASERTKKFVDSKLEIGDKKFEVVNDFVFL